MVIRPCRTAATTNAFWDEDKFKRSLGGKSASVTRVPSGPMKNGSMVWGLSDKD